MRDFRVFRILLAGVIAFQVQAAIPAFASTDSELKACVSAICGPFDGLLNAAGGGSFKRLRPIDVQALITTNLNPTMTNIMETDLAVTQMDLRLWDQADQILNPYILSDDQKVLLSLAAFLQIDWDKAGTAFGYDNGSNIKVNRKKLATLLPEMEPWVLAWASDILETAYNSKGMQGASAIENAPYETMLKMINVEPSGAAAFAQSVLVSAKNIQDHFGEVFITDAQLSVTQKIANNEPVQTYEKNLYVAFVSQILRMQEFIDGDTRTLILKNPAGLDQAKKMIGGTIDKIRNAISAPQKLAALRTKMLNICDDNVTAYLAAAPSKFLNSRLLALTEKIKSSAVAVLPNYLSGIQLIAATNAVKSAKFQPPTDSDEVKVSLGEHFAMRLHDSEHKGSLISSVPGSKQQTSYLLQFLFSLQDAHEDLSKSVFHDLNQYCDYIKPPQLVDKALSKSGEIIVSWQSAIWQQYGSGILAHELGHVVSAAVNAKDDLKETRQCQSNQHQVFYASGASLMETNSEEDWADTFSISVQKNLRASGWPYTANFGCLLVGVDIKKNDFADEALDLTTDSTESHSSGMYRLIQQQIGTGKLPQSCLNLSDVKSKPITSCAK